MKLLRGLFYGLLGFIVFWISGSASGIIAPVWIVGKNVFILYISLLAFFILFIPIYFVSGIYYAYRLKQGRLIYLFLFGLMLNPAIILGDVILGLVEIQENMFNKNGSRFTALMIIAAFFDLVFSLSLYFILEKSIRSRSTAATKKSL